MSAEQIEDTAKAFDMKYFLTSCVDRVGVEGVLDYLLVKISKEIELENLTPDEKGSRGLKLLMDVGPEKPLQPSKPNSKEDPSIRKGSAVKTKQGDGGCIEAACNLI